MGIQGRYIYWAAGVAGGAIVGFIIAYCLVGFVAGLVVLVAVVSTGIALIMLKQRKGLHTKKDGRRSVYLRPLEETVRRKRKTITGNVWSC